MNSKSMKALLLSAAMTGLLAGANAATTPDTSTQQPDLRESQHRRGQRSPRAQ